MTHEATGGALDQGASARIRAIDMLRGLVVVIMALDHIRDYTHQSGWAMNPLDLQASNPILYFTRWVTHLCAPTFVFLAGASIRFQSLRGKTGAKLAGFLVTRGLWLIALELTVIGFAWSFSVPYVQLIQVIWAIGWSMIIMAGLIFLPPMVTLVIGLIIVVGHTFIAATFLPPPAAPNTDVWTFLYYGRGFLPDVMNPQALIAYPILPWFGLMALGYGVGHWLASEKRDRYALIAGLVLIAAFIVLRGFNLYGDPRPWSPQADWVKTAMDIFNVQKNPPSLHYVCITLGISALLLVGLSKLQGFAAKSLAAIGSVPLMAYVAHVFLMHLVALLSWLIAGKDAAGQFDTMRNFFAHPEVFGDGLPLWVSYLDWLIVAALLVPLSLWWSSVKRRRRDWWLSYL